MSPKLRRALPVFLRLVTAPFVASALPVAEPANPALDRQFTQVVRPFVAQYCVGVPQRRYASRAVLISRLIQHGYGRSRLSPLGAGYRQANLEADAARGHARASDQERQKVVDWVKSHACDEARKHAGDPGPVLARRLSNAEYNYTIRDLTGVDIQPTREFPVDPANQAGFDNSGESLTMSPALLNKYLQARTRWRPHGADARWHRFCADSDAGRDG